jgi:hypothetical protein
LWDKSELKPILFQEHLVILEEIVKHQPSMLFVILILMAFLASAVLGGLPASAQADLHPTQPEPGNPYLTYPDQPFRPGSLDPETGRITGKALGSQITDREFFDSVSLPVNLAPNGGPDEFGYTYDPVAFEWVDATDGFDAGFSGYAGYENIRINLPFTFQYYTNSYSEVWVNSGGYLAFDEWNAYRVPYYEEFLRSYRPNNLIAPLASRYNLATAGPANRVYYKTGGQAPNRYLVVEWYQVQYANSPYPGETRFTFEVILYENGAFKFQYSEIYNGGGYFCSDIVMGIENAYGNDGLKYMNYCQVPPSNSAIRFTPPPDRARVLLFDKYNGSFTGPNETIKFDLEILNYGTLGADTFDLNTSANWPVTYRFADGTPCTDTNGNGLPDTGLMPQGSTTLVQVRIESPAIINPTEYQDATVEIRSGLDPGTMKAAYLQVSAPAAFAQAYSGQGGDLLAYGSGVYLATPATQIQRLYNDTSWNMNLVELPGGQYIFVNSQYRALNENNWYPSVTEIYTSIIDREGQVVRALTKLADHSNATVSTEDTDIATAVAPDGSIGLVWTRQLYNIDTSEYLRNVYFTILNPDGSVKYGPMRLTSNDQWGNWSTYYLPRYGGTTIAATDNNRFVIAWDESMRLPDNSWSENIYLTVRNTNGAEIKTITRLTDPAAGQFNAPFIKQISGARLLLLFTRFDGTNNHATYQLLDSNGSVIQPDTLVPGADNWAAQPIFAEFGNGNLAVVWSLGDRYRYVILNSLLNQVAGPFIIYHPAMSVSQYYSPSMSMALDPNGNLVMTWNDPEQNNQKNLYFAIINPAGEVMTQTMIFLKSKWGSLLAGKSGYSLATYTMAATTGGVDLEIQAPEYNPAIPAGTGSIPVRFASLGEGDATSVTVTMVLPDGVVYLGDNSGVTPIQTSQVAGNSQTTLTWVFPKAISFMGAGRFAVQVGIGDVPIGTTYPVTISIDSFEGDDLIGNNDITVTVFSAYQVYLPLSRR